MAHRFTCIVLLLVVALSTGNALAAPQKGASGSEADQEMAEITMALKAAARTGAMSGSDARALWASLQAEFAADKVDSYPGNGKRETTLRIGWVPIEIREILQPEFVRRDLVLIRDVLTLEAEQVSIIESLLEDYITLFDVASEPLRDALGRYRRVQRDRRVARAFENADLSTVGETVFQKLREFEQQRERENWGPGEKDSGGRGGSRSAEKRRAEFREYSDKLAGSIETMEARLTQLRMDVRERMSEASLKGEAVTAADLVRLADAFKLERDKLRLEFSEYLALVTNAETSEVAREFLGTAMDKLAIEHGREDGGLGGESLDIRSAMVESGLGLDQSRRIDAYITEREPALARLVEDRLALKINREIGSMDLLARYDRAVDAGADPDDALRPADLRPFIMTCLDELEASIAVRDELLLQLATCTAMLMEADQQVAMTFRDEMLRTGFRGEMARTWSEQALAVARRFEELDDEVLQAILDLELAVGVDTRDLREEAVADRIEGDPERTRNWLEGMLEADRSGKGGKDEDEWAQAEWERREDYIAIDDWTEGNLKSILTSEQFAQLPPRRSGKKDGDSDKAAAEKKAAAGKGEAKGGGKGDGAGSDGKSGGRSTGKSRGKGN